MNNLHKGLVFALYLELVFLVFLYFLLMILFFLQNDAAPEAACAADAPAAAAAPFASVAVIGLGLIGASLAAALADKMPSVRVFGVDTDPAACATAVERGWCAEAGGPDDAAFRAFVEGPCELVVIATPVAAVDDYLTRLRDWGYTGLVTDTISTKGHILAAAEELLPAPARYVPGHPMAGSEQSGIAGARADLFEGANWILCPDERTAPEDFQRMHELITGLDARVVSLRREEHDSAIAIVSHVPHMVASSAWKEFLLIIHNYDSFYELFCIITKIHL